MAMSRLNAADYLAGVLGPIFTEIELDQSDVPGGFTEIIDDSLMMVGVSHDDANFDDVTYPLIAAADVIGFRKVLRYVALEKVYDAILNRVDINLSTPSVTKNRSQFVRQMENRIRFAREAAEPFIADSGAWGTGVYTLGDWIEPVAS